METQQEQAYLNLTVPLILRETFKTNPTAPEEPETVSQLQRTNMLRELGPVALPPFFFVQHRKTKFNFNALT